MRIGIIAALPGELKPLVHGWDRHRTAAKGISIWTKKRGEDEIVAVCGGMGADAAVRSFSAAEFLGPLDAVLSVGWAGALHSEMRTGHCYQPSEIIDVQTGERTVVIQKGATLSLATTNQVVGPIEKKRLHESYGAVLVDMEAATVARLARMREIPIYCFKAVSDGAEINLLDINPFIDSAGHLRTLPFVAHVMVRPKLWPSLIQLASQTSRAARSLAAELEQFLLEIPHAISNKGVV